MGGRNDTEGDKERVEGGKSEGGSTRTGKKGKGDKKEGEKIMRDCGR